MAERWRIPEGGVGALPPGKFTAVHGFRIALEPAGSLGEHLTYRDGAGEVVATFPWWDHAWAWLKAREPSYRACGSVDEPFSDVEQGWEQLAWEKDGWVYLLQGAFDGQFHIHVKIHSAEFDAEWRRVIAEAKNRHESVETLEEAFAFADQVRTLVLRDRPQSLPDEFAKLVHLEQLRISMSELRALPESVCRCAQLWILDVPMNALEQLPERLGDLKALQVLNVADNAGLRSLPSSLGGCAALREIQTNGAPIESLPESLGDLAKLETLSLYSSVLTKLPESIGKLAALQDLTMSRSKLTALPESFAALRALRQLYADGNQLTVLPPLNGLTQLQVLDLSNNALTEIPGELMALPLLERIHLSQNRITRLPEWVERLPALKIFELEDNPLDAESRERLARLQERLGPPRYS